MWAQSLLVASWLLKNKIQNIEGPIGSAFLPPTSLTSPATHHLPQCLHQAHPLAKMTSLLFLPNVCHLSVFDLAIPSVCTALSQIPSWLKPILPSGFSRGLPCCLLYKRNPRCPLYPPYQLHYSSLLSLSIGV